MCSCSFLLSDKTPADTTSAPAQVSLWVQPPQADFIVHHGDKQSLGAALCVAMEAPRASRYARTRSHTFITSAPMSTTHCSYRAVRRPELRRDNSSHYRLILYSCFSTSSECMKITQNTTSSAIILKDKGSQLLSTNKRTKI